MSQKAGSWFEASISPNNAAYEFINKHGDTLYTKIIKQIGIDEKYGKTSKDTKKNVSAKNSKKTQKAASNTTPINSTTTPTSAPTQKSNSGLSKKSNLLKKVILKYLFNIARATYKSMTKEKRKIYAGDNDKYGAFKTHFNNYLENFILWTGENSHTNSNVEMLKDHIKKVSTTTSYYYNNNNKYQPDTVDTRHKDINTILNSDNISGIKDTFKALLEKEKTINEKDHNKETGPTDKLSGKHNKFLTSNGSGGKIIDTTNNSSLQLKITAIKSNKQIFYIIKKHNHKEINPSLSYDDFFIIYSKMLAATLYAIEYKRDIPNDPKEKDKIKKLKKDAFKNLIKLFNDKNLALNNGEGLTYYINKMDA